MLQFRKTLHKNQSYKLKLIYTGTNATNPTTRDLSVLICLHNNIFDSNTKDLILHLKYSHNLSFDQIKTGIEEIRKTIEDFQTGWDQYFYEPFTGDLFTIKRYIQQQETYFLTKGGNIC